MCIRQIVAILCFAFALTVGAADPPLAEHTDEGFAVPQPGHELSFPAAHGSHPAFKIEWWYITGHLYAGERRFGFQATFFRFATRPPAGDATAAVATENVDFQTGELHLAHMSLLDVATGTFYHQERLNRAGWDAAATVGRVAVHNGSWSLKAVPDATAAEAADPPMQLRGGVRGEVAWDLRLRPAQPHVIFGVDGVSRKGAADTAASYYITYPRLATTGSLRLGEETLAVTGQTWMDHEISSSQLGERQVGWDWTSIQLDDGRALMVYILRRDDGTPDPYSTLAWIEADGTVRHQAVADFSMKATRHWTSPHTGGEYPVAWTLSSRDPATGAERTLRLEPLADDQEVRGVLGRVTYWEGACRVLDADGTAIGSAYLELTGYAESMQGRLR